MTQKQIIILSVLGVALVGALYWQFFRESDQDRQYRENMAKDAAASPGAGAPAPAAGSPAGSPAAAPANSAVSAARSRFESDTVNVDELLASVKEVDFDYSKDKPARDPMAPLIGASTKKGGTPVIGTQGTAPEKGPDPALVQTAKAMKVSGIMWNDKEPLAVVDNTVVGPGYAFPNGISVDSITKTQVILKVQNQTIPIELKEQ